MIKTLIVEDEVWVRKGIIKIIDWEALGMVLSGEAENGEEAFQVFLEVKPDLVVMDMKMPKYSGVDFLKKVSEMNHLCEIVVISGYSDYEYMKQAISSGVFEYILKPVDEEYLNEVLRKAKKRLESRKDMESKLNAGISLLVDNAVNHLVSERIESLNVLHKHIAAAGLNLDYRAFSVILMELKDDPFRDDGGWEKASQLIMEDLTTGLAELKPRHFDMDAARSTLTAGQVIILCKSNESNIKLLEETQEEVFANIIAMQEQKTNTGLKAAVGSWKQDIRNISRSFREAGLALRYERMHGPDIVFFERVKASDNSCDIERLVDEKQVCYLLQNLGDNKAFDYIDSLFDSLGNKEYCYIPALRKVLIKFMLMVEKHCEDTGINLKNVFETGYIDHLEKVVCVRGLKQWTVNMLQRIAPFVITRLNRNDRSIIEIIKEYIDNHYSEDINLIYLAQKYYMNHIYLSRLFKASTGENFIDYLTRVRMAKAKELLEMGTLKVKDVAELVGYNNPYYFAKSFKRYFGYSPSDIPQTD